MPGRPGSNALPADQVLARLKPILEDRGILKIGHDMKGAARLLLRHGIQLTPYDCTMLISYVLDGGQFDHTIEDLTGRVAGHELRPLKELVGTGKSQVAFVEIAPEAARDFTAIRADAALRLHAALKARLVAEHMTTLYETVERPLVPAVAAMEQAGIKVDRGALSDLSTDFARRIAEIEAAIYRDIGSDFNIGSPKQLGDVLFDKLNLPGGRKGKTGAYGTDGLDPRSCSCSRCTRCPPACSKMPAPADQAGSRPMPTRSPRKSTPTTGASTPPMR